MNNRLDKPLYFITFTTYGTWIHGQCPGSVDRHHNVVGTDWIAPDPQLKRYQMSHMRGQPFRMDTAARAIVQATLLEVAAYRGWAILAANVLPTHVHLLVQATAQPEKVMRDFKSYATRRLREQGYVDNPRNVWTEHGSTRWINNRVSILPTIRYILDRQEDRSVIIEPPEGTMT